MKPVAAISAGWALSCLLTAWMPAPAMGQGAPDAPPTGAAPAPTGSPARQAADEVAPEGEFFESIDVSVVNIDVYVTDKKGKRILGLGKDDFELFEDRRPIQITNFYAVEDGDPVLAGDEGATGTLETPATTARELAATELPEDQRLHLVVYVDNWSLKPFSRNRTFSFVREFLRNKLSRGDRVMLITYDRQPHVRRPFTADPVGVAAALFELEDLSGNGARIDADRRDLLNEIADAEARDRVGLETQVRNYSESLYNDLSFQINALKELVSTLAGLPGRKAILYLSEGLDMVPGEDLYYALQEKFPNASNSVLEARNYDLSRRFRELTSAANASRISFYTVDAAGLRSSTSASVQQRTAGASSIVDSVYWGNIQGSIRLMADETGGTAIVNTNVPTQGLDVIAADFRNYYSLGYTPARVSDGRYHKVEVKTKEKGYIVRHRDGYRDRPVETRMSDGVQSALHFDIASNPLEVQIDRRSEALREDGHYLVQLSVRIPLGKLVIVPQGNRHVARLRLFFAALDDEGRMSDVSESKLPIEIPEEELENARGGFYRYDVPLLMRRGPQRLAVGLRDELGQVSSFAVKTFLVGG